MKQNDLDLRADRREFTVAALLAMLGGVSITISGCGGSPAGPSGPAAPTPAPVIDKTDAISSNHGHAAVITSAQFGAAGALALSLQGTSSHNHMLELSAAEVLQIAEGRTFAKECTGTSHTHVVTFN